MILRKYVLGEGGLMNWIWDFDSATTTAMSPLNVYNSEEFDLVPRKSYIEKQVKFKEEELTRLKQRRDNELKYYESQEKKLNLELEQLKQRLSG